MCEEKERGGCVTLNTEKQTFWGGYIIHFTGVNNKCLSVCLHQSTKTITNRERKKNNIHLHSTYELTTIWKKGDFFFLNGYREKREKIFSVRIPPCLHFFFFFLHVNKQPSPETHKSEDCIKREKFFVAQKILSCEFQEEKKKKVTS